MLIPCFPPPEQKTKVLSELRTLGWRYRRYSKHTAPVSGLTSVDLTLVVVQQLLLTSYKGLLTIMDHTNNINKIIIVSRRFKMNLGASKFLDKIKYE